MDTFCTTWELNEESQEAFRNLDEDLQNDVMEGFAPRDTSRDVNNLFMSYIRSLHRNKALVPQDHHAEFFAKWNLADTKTQQLLLSLPQATQTEIMEKFQPRDATSDCTNVFLSFVKKRYGSLVRNQQPEPAFGFKRPSVIGAVRTQPAPVHSGPPADTEAVEAFISQYDLNENAQELLLSLPQATQTEVMEKFQPRDTSTDCTNVFLSFVKKRYGSYLPQNQLPEATFSKHPKVIGAARTQQPSPVALGPPADPETVKAFCIKWGLNEESVEFFESLDPRMQTDVIDNFEPRDTSRDANPIFLAFVRSRTGVAPRRSAKPQVAQTKSAIQTGVTSRAGLKRVWNLTNESLAVFDQLSAIAQKHVMAEFNPRDTSRDANACFVSFCKSRAALCFAATWNLNDDAIQLFNELSGEMQQEILAGFAPRDTSKDVNNVFMSYVRSRQKSSVHPGPKNSRKRPLDKLTVFAEEWRLHSDNVALLESLSVEDQTEVLSKFQPRDVSRDCNGIFKKFVTSVLNNK